jgi:membrane protease YdiL (CAAX protease family)
VFAWAAALAVWISSGKSWVEPVAIGVIFGLALPALVLLLTIGVSPLVPIASRSWTQMIFVAAYLVALAVYLARYHGLAVDTVTQFFGPGEAAHQAAKLLVKLAVFVVVPGFIMRAVFGRSWASLGWNRLTAMLRPRHVLAAIVLAAAVCAVNFVVGPGQEITHAAQSVSLVTFIAGMAFTMVWLVIEVGLVEEFMFRGIVQSTVEAFTRSPLAGIFLTGIAFGLAHAPGLILGRGVDSGLAGDHSTLAVLAYSILVLTCASFLVGVLWVRTRNLLLLMFVHAATDLLPNYVEMAHAFGIDR